MVNLTLFTLIFATPIYLVYALILKLLKKRTDWKISICFIEFIFCCYFVNLLRLTGMFNICLSNFSDSHASPNIVPIINTLKEVMDYGFYVLKQVCLNILLFVPFGLLVGLIKQSGRNILIASLIISVTIEALQYYNGRFADIDDVIWNVSGALIGYLIYLSYQKIKHLLMIPKAATN